MCSEEISQLMTRPIVVLGGEGSGNDKLIIAESLVVKCIQADQKRRSSS